MKVDVAVVGGGPAGLSRAFWMLREHPELRLIVLEASERAGGHVRTEWREGYACEIGPQGYRPGEASDPILDALGLRERELAASAAARRRFVAIGGRLHALPTGPGELARTDLLSASGKLRLLTEPFRRRGTDPQESLASFVARRLGPQAVTLADALAAGIYGGAADRIEVASAFPVLARLEREHGSLLRGGIAMLRSRPRPLVRRPALCTFEDGMRELVQALSRELGDRLRTSWPIREVRRGHDGWRLVPAGDEHPVVEAERLVLATPAWVSARLVRPFDFELGGALGEIPFAPVVNVYLGFDASVAEKLDGFGFLVAASERSPVLGALYCSSIFPGRAPAGRVLVRVMAGGVRHPEAAEWPAERLVRTAVEVLRSYTGLGAPVRFGWTKAVPRAIPQYEPGHAERLRRIRRCVERHVGLELCGNSYEEVSLTGQVRVPRRSGPQRVPEPASHGCR